MSDGNWNPDGDDNNYDDGDNENDDYDYGNDDVDEDGEEELIETDSPRRSDIINGLHASSLQHLVLSDEPWVTSVATESFQSDVENLIAALQSNRSLTTIFINGDVLAAIGESNQGRLFRSMGNLPTLQRMMVYRGAGSASAIHIRVLAEALSETSNGINFLQLFGFKISSRSEVGHLARGLKARAGSLRMLCLVDIVLDVEDKTGFLDPILLALAPVPGEPRRQLYSLTLSCVAAESSGASAVSPEALGAFFSEESIEMPGRTSLHLNNLGLNDNHCAVMAQELTRADALLRPILKLGLTDNPSIGQPGYEALLGLLNRRVNIGTVIVDDENWQTTFDLVISMNFEHHRGRFLENGVFPSKEMLVDFLVELASTDHYWSQAQKLDAIWYTLREDPDLIYT
jgi:hypothetical protein